MVMSKKKKRITHDSSRGVKVRFPFSQISGNFGSAPGSAVNGTCFVGRPLENSREKWKF